jgi:CoA:oxalate CoA-transferase
VERADRLRRAHRLRPGRRATIRRSTTSSRRPPGRRAHRRPGGPPTLPGYSSADNSAGLTAALGLLAQIVSGRGGQVEVSLRDVMLSQLNYRASAYLNEGTEPRRLPFGAHSYYVPAQLFPDRRGLPGAVHHARRLLEVLRRRGRRRGVRDDGRAGGAARRGAGRGDPGAGRRHRRGLGGPAAPLGVPAAAVRTLPEALAATPEADRDGRRLPAGRSPIRVAGYEPDYGPPPRGDPHRFGRGRIRVPAWPGRCARRTRGPGGSADAGEVLGHRRGRA